LTVAVVAAWATLQAVYVRAEAVPATSPTVACPNPEGQPFVMPPEIVTQDGILKGSIILREEDQRLPESFTFNGTVECAPQLVRNFRGENRWGESLPPMPAAQPPDSNLRDPEPGPTLRARVGDLVQLTFVNSINPRRFDEGYDIDDCSDVGQDGNIYPVGGAGKAMFQDKFPNCLHASSTANIHFHGTHTNPNATGDNVYLQVRPLPRDNQGNLTTSPKEASAGFAEFFRKCAEELQNPLNPWPVTWGDVPPWTNKSWTGKQTELLVAYQQKNPGQALWDRNKEVLKESWPIYYIGAFPYCFALPAYTYTAKDAQGKAKWPPPPGSTSPIMGQAPGTHWYHAHKHGSTAINVANGMTGAFIIEGDYDKDLNDAYRSYILNNGAWNTRSQKVLVLNQLGTELNAMTPTRARGGPPGNPGGVDFSVNGRLRPKIAMQPGEIQLWRIVNTSGRTAVYFMPPRGLEWQQIAQDGVQYAPRSYKDGANLNKPFYMAPANRVDLLVKAPMNMKGKSAEVRIQNVMARSAVRPSPDETDPVEGTVLLIVGVIDGPPVMHNGQSQEMPFLTESNAPTLPPFLTDISDEEWKRSNSITRTFVFNSKKPVLSSNDPSISMARQHTINDIQFDEEHSHINVLLNATEEWIIKNTTNQNAGPGNSPIDHPLHIHINPFQVTEVFDPNESFVEKTTENLVKRYVFDKDAPLVDGQCRLSVDDETSWKPCHNTKIDNWWDVFAIPAARVEKGKVIPGYFKMRSRFVDYAGLYVMHCHILIHEDRGMMFRVEVLKAKSAPAAVRHH
jgi:FtsP/CotA-like multicopper oxidase with cupredoxin domain